MQLKKYYKKEITKKIICITLLLIIALLSITVISKIATSPESYKDTIQSIDEKKTAVMGVSAGAAMASAGLAAIPGDATTPIANQIMELSSYLFIVVCVLFLEKSLLTVLGYLAFNFMIPLACILLGIHTISNKNILKILAFRLMAFALMISLIIPLCIKISDKIYEINKNSVEQITITIDENIEDDQSEESKLWIDKISDKIKETTSDVGEKAKQVLNVFVDAIAVFIIAYCVIPILIVIMAIWFINFMFGLKIPIPNVKRIASKINFKNIEKIDEEELIEV